MSKFEVLCVTMKQRDFSKIKEMNIHSNVVFANQADTTSYEELKFEDYTAKMITTATRGVGINRNLSLMYASADICLFADDDVVYNDDYQDVILREFEAHPDADIFIFHFDTDSERKQKRYNKTQKCGKLSRQPWAGFRIAFRLTSVRKANLNFTTVFGGGCIFPSGEDSMWLNDAKKAGLTIYVSKETIGNVSFEHSTWFTGVDKKFYFAKGAYYQAVHPKTFALWTLYFILRTHKTGELSIKQRLHWMKIGRKSYKSFESFETVLEK